MKHLNYREEQMNAFKLKMASLTYFTIFSTSKHPEDRRKLRQSKSYNVINWSGKLEAALSSFNTAGNHFRNNPTIENSEKYKAARALYYEVLLEKHASLPKAVVEDGF
ncbi:hypothetical protein KO493_08175 [Tamlana agarivorans]|uniref:Uncharacterized protein n=1 Tax=Pseudotamlana agarivorans TaxID=481183 RepID=A0ACC5U8N4_9FLAO|nr:hypothetical protein [Tamlana agarivorans]MBU2950669.1 hypothetical protein [Tamlana agarivorans]